QLEARFAERFAGRRIVSLHSGLTPAQRLAHWLAAHLGLADLVLGTRLAVFASLPQLALIVVDEEHDPSYKQQEGARYSARDLAVYRGKVEAAKVLLGSATPSLESWHASERGRYRRLAMPSRIGPGRPHAALPSLRLRGACAARLPGVRQRRHRAARPRHREPGGAAGPAARGQPAARRPAGAHPADGRGHHAAEGRARAAARAGACGRR